MRNKILALSLGEFFDTFTRLYSYCKSEFNYKIIAISNSKSIENFSNFINSPDDLIMMPSIMKKSEWEDDPNVVKKIEQLIASAEKSVNVPVSRLLLSNERTIGRAYSKSHYYWAERKLAKLAIKDKNIGRIILIRLFKFANDVISEQKPSLCLSSPTCGMWNTTFYYIAKYYRIPYLACNTSLVAKGRHFWTPSWGSFNTEIEEHYASKLIKKDEPSERALAYIKEFRQVPDAFPHIHSEWANFRASLTIANMSKEVFKRFIIRILPLIKFQKVSNPKPFFQFALDHYRTCFLVHWQQRLYQSLSEKELASINYIYYPFHLDPEMVLNVMAPSWHNQLNTIKMLSYNLPMNYKLLVREHRFNIGRRPTAYLKQISQFPGVVLIDANDSQYKYIKNAKLVVTVNGTTGFEGILLKKPVLTLDKTFYDSLAFAKRAASYPDLGAAILDAIDSFKISEDYDKKLATFLDAEHEITLSRDADSELDFIYIKKLLKKYYQVEDNIKMLEKV